MSRLFVAVALLSFVALSAAAPAGDLITSLPGYGPPPTKHYSGLIPADDAKTVWLHYWFVQSAGNPATDPVVIWMNGGPGCSSLEGYMYELGPFYFNGTDSTGFPQLTTNSYGWNQISNVLYIEHPAGVGFSYTVNGSTTTDDFVQSQNTFGFLLNWYGAFPEYVNNSLFITGESYAGIYVPTLANRILVSNNAGINPHVNLVGFAVGNGCIGNSVGTCGNDNDAYKIEVDFFAGHAMIDQATYAAINAECGDYSNPTQKCINLVNGALDQVGNIDVYNVYDTCGDDTVVQPLSSVIGRSRAPNAALRKIRDPVTCISSAYGGTYLNDPTVRKAIHVDGVNLTSWTVCPGVDYNANLVSLLPTYPDLIKAYRVLIYSGDADACVPYNGSEEWTRKLGITPTNPWHSYYVNSGGSNHVGGYVTEYGTNFQYVTVKHAGHMVPKFEPESGFYMFSQWLNNKPL